MFRIRHMCRVLGVSASGYYAWRVRPRSRRSKTDVLFSQQLRAVWVEHRSVYGAVKLWRAVTAAGLRIGKHQVARLMRAEGLRGVCRSKRWQRSPKETTPAADLVDRSFRAGAPNQLWVADITYVPTRVGFLYLAVVLDVFSRRIVGWSMRSHLRSSLVEEALQMAVEVRRPAAVIHHSDQGCQYTSVAFGNRCRDLGVIASMGSVGDCYDNAMCESFFATLEAELLSRHSFDDHAEARRHLFDYIEGFYNSRRLHSALDYRAPFAYERHYQSTTYPEKQVRPPNPG